jgi:hypothetical protein
MKDYKDIEEDVPNQIKLYHMKSLGVKVMFGSFFYSPGCTCDADIICD